MMQIGIDAYTISGLRQNPFQQLDYVREHEFEGFQFGVLGTDSARLGEIRAHADSLGLYSHVSVPSPNPHLGEQSPEELEAVIRDHVEAAAACGWHELHSTLGNEQTRYEHAAPWSRQLPASAEMLRRLRPVLRAHGSRINIETHGEVTTFELARLAEEVGPDICGICLDTANVLLFAEDPVAAARRAAPYTHLTHIKDAIVYFCERGAKRQGRPPGRGVVDWERVIPILAEHEPELGLSIEDHKMIFEAPIFDPAWRAEQADLSRDELAEFVRLTWDCQSRIATGELPDPDEYEAIPYLDEMPERLEFARRYLAALLKRLGLRED